MKVYCEKCDAHVKPIYEEYDSEFKVRGKSYKYRAYRGICSECKEIVDPIPDKDLKSRDEAFRREEKIITVNEINDLIGKYNIGKKPLAELLGWGENTILRYIEGDMPSKIYSEELLKILNNSQYMIELLDKRPNVLTEVAERKVRNAIKKSEEDNISEIDVIASYIIQKGAQITPLALQKLLYYAQGFFAAFFDSFLFQDECQAWVHGPVYVRIYEKYKSFVGNIIDEKVTYNFDEYIDESKREFLDLIVEFFGLYTGVALERMTHYEQPWLIARNGEDASERGTNIIDKEIIKSYFKEVKAYKEMLNVCDIKKYSNDIFDKIQFA